jgi:UDP-N-acetylglucosamine transferase subunit ALG13
MIFVTVGSSGFPRLIRKMDEIAGEIDEPVVMQIGLTKYSCRRAKYFQFLNHEDIITYIRQARIIVCHDGVGTILSALQFDLPILAIPRLKKFGETYFDNQGDFINALSTERRIKTVYNVDELRSALENIGFERPHVKPDEQEGIVHALAEYIDQLQTQKLNRHRVESKSG